MAANYGPVESWLRFLLIAVFTLVWAGGFLWVSSNWLGAVPWWADLFIVLAGLAIIVVGYERLIGWK